MRFLMGAGMQAAGQTIPRFSRETARDAQADPRNTPSAQERKQTGAQTEYSRAAAVAPTDDQVQAALAKALKSSEFQSAPQLRAFLGFVVHATLNKEQEKIKGYTIAVEALGRPDDFNPVVDPIVRVEAARLRRRLEKYYAGSGTEDPFRIAIPKGSYAPVFYPAGCDLAAEAEEVELSAFADDGPATQTALPASKPDMQVTRAGSPEAETADPAATRTAGAASPGTGSNAPSDKVSDLTQVLHRLSERRYSAWLVLAFGAGCFIAGYFAATI
jgi:hypothetical protein